MTDFLSRFTAEFKKSRRDARIAEWNRRVRLDDAKIKKNRERRRREQKKVNQQ